MHRLALCLIPALLLAQPDPRELIRNSAEAIKQYKSYQIESVVLVETRGAGVDNKLEIPSSISVRRPDRLRIESKNKTLGVLVVSDGEHIWYYMSHLKQYIKREASGSPESAVISSGFLPKNLPDPSTSVKSVKLSGEDGIDLGGEKIPCWVVETTYDKIALPGQNASIIEAVQINWISKDKGLSLQSTFGAKLVLPGMPQPVEMTQSTRTTALRLNVDLPDSLFVFTPPEGSKETADWSLPGVAKPDIIGKAPPAFTGKSLDGKEIDLAALRGKVVLIDFWATWCGPCKRELPAIQKVHTEFRDKGLVVLGVSVGEEKATIEKFLKTAGLTYPVFRVDEATDLVSKLSVTGFPTVVLLDRDGKVASYEVGARGEDALRKDLAKLGISAAK